MKKLVMLATVCTIALITTVPSFTKDRNKLSDEDKALMTQERLEGAACTLEEVKAEAELLLGNVSLVTSAEFECEFDDGAVSSCSFSVNAVTDGGSEPVRIELEYNEACELVPPEFFMPEVCTAELAIMTAKDSVITVPGEELILGKIEQELEESIDPATGLPNLNPIWEVELSHPGPPFMEWEFRIGDSPEGCVILEDEDDESSDDESSDDESSDDESSDDESLDDPSADS